MKQLKLGIPKGSLEKSTIDLFRRAGWKIRNNSRNYFPSVDDETLRLSLVRAQEMSPHVEDGVLDVGLTGKDWILENESDVVEVCDLVYSKATSTPARWVLVVPGDSKIVRIDPVTGEQADVITGLTTAVDLAVGENGNIFKQLRIDIGFE